MSKPFYITELDDKFELDDLHGDVDDVIKRLQEVNDVPGYVRTWIDIDTGYGHQEPATANLYRMRLETDAERKQREANYRAAKRNRQRAKAEAEASDRASKLQQYEKLKKELGL